MTGNGPFLDAGSGDVALRVQGDRGMYDEIGMHRRSGSIIFLKIYCESCRVNYTMDVMLLFIASPATGARDEFLVKENTA